LNHFSIKNWGSNQQGNLFLKNIIEKIYNKFIKGIGIGLIVSNKLSQLIGPDQIFIKSEKGKGSTFSFSFYKNINYQKI
jgi:hypothetical protein